MGQYIKSFRGQINKAYALKSITFNEIYKKASFIDTIIKDQKALMKLSNHHIIKLYYGFRVKNTIYEIMEYASGRELSKYLRSKPRGCISEDEARWFIGQVCRGLDYCHQEGIVHLNIKPQNLLIQNDHYSDTSICDDKNYSNIDESCTENKHKSYKDMVIKISDFSAASFKTVSLGKSRMCVDDLMYKSPEYLTNSENVALSKAIDVWSVGIVLFEMLFGYHPFEGENWAETKYNIINNQIQYNKRSDSFNITLSPDCHQLLEGMLHKNPVKRWNLLKIINHRWFDIPSSTDVTKAFRLTSIRCVKFADDIHSPIKIKPINSLVSNENKKEEEKVLKIELTKRKAKKRKFELNKKKIKIKELQNHVIDAIVKCVDLNDGSQHPRLCTQDKKSDDKDSCNIKNIKDLQQLMAFYRNSMMKRVHRPACVHKKQSRNLSIDEGNIVIISNNKSISDYASIFSRSHKRRKCKRRAKISLSSVREPLRSSMDYEKPSSCFSPHGRFESERLSINYLNQRFESKADNPRRKESILTVSVNDTSEEGEMDDSIINQKLQRSTFFKNSKAPYHARLRKELSMQRKSVQECNDSIEANLPALLSPQKCTTKFAF